MLEKGRKKCLRAREREEKSSRTIEQLQYHENAKVFSKNFREYPQKYCQKIQTKAADSQNFPNVQNRTRTFENSKKCAANRLCSREEESSQISEL